jgi:hypothetical protein
VRHYGDAAAKFDNKITATSHWEPHSRNTSKQFKGVLPVTFATMNGERWSWCDSKMQRLQFKRSIADAAVDGVVPIGHLRSRQQALKDQLGWLKRLEEGEVETITRPRMLIPLPPANADEDERRRVRYGEFSLMNNRINMAHSTATHQRTQANPDEWGEYHSRYREKRREWPLVPFEEVRGMLRREGVTERQPKPNQQRAESPLCWCPATAEARGAPTETSLLARPISSLAARDHCGCCLPTYHGSRACE